MLAMLFAQISDTVWLAILGIVAMVVKEFFDRTRAREVAAKVETVAKDLTQATASREAHEVITEAAAEKIEKVIEKVDAIHATTNSMSDKLAEASTKLVEATAKASQLAGEKQGRAEAEHANAVKGAIPSVGSGADLAVENLKVENLEVENLKVKPDQKTETKKR